MEVFLVWVGLATAIGLFLWGMVLHHLAKGMDRNIQFKVTFQGVALWYLFWPILFLITIWYVISLRNRGGLLSAISQSSHSRVKGDQEAPGRPLTPGIFSPVGDGHRKGQVHVIPYIVGDIVTHYLENRDGAVHIYRMGSWSLKQPLQFPEGEADHVAPSLPEATDWIFRDDDFLYLCNPLRVEKLAAWHTRRRQGSN